jgi:polygalacturonase
MKSRISIIFILLAFVVQQNIFSFEKERTTNSSGWKQLPKILKNIKPPVFSKREFCVTDFGAVNDDKVDSKPAIDKAIEKCAKAGGGRVIVPKGIYFVKGPIHFKSNVNLHLEDGVIIKFSVTPKDYLPVVFTRWEGVECYNYSPLIYAYGQKNIAITGKGTFDGQANNTNWWWWKAKKQFGWKEGMPSQQDSLCRPLLLKMNSENVSVEKRIFGTGRYLRPCFVQFYKCKNILLKDVTFINSPMWVLNPVLCQNISFVNVSAVSNGPNTDGCDPESCKDVLIKNCFFKNGDDCIAIKSGRNNDGRRINIPSENIVIQNCKMKDGHGGVTIGSEISGGCKNVFAENCEMDSPNLDRAIRIKANTLRGGLVKNVFVRNIKIGEVGTVLHFDMLYEPDEGSDGGFLPVWSNFQFENLTSKKSHQAYYMVGLKNSKIKNVFVKACSFEGVDQLSKIENVIGFQTKNVLINGKVSE